MPKANIKRGEINLPGFGILRFTLSAMERLEAELGENWLPELHGKLGGLHFPTIKLCLEAATAHARSGDIDYAPLGEPGGLSIAVDAIHDAISYAVFGKSHAALMEEAEQREAERQLRGIERLQENPQMAAAWLRGLGISDTVQGSDQTKSEDSPQ